MTDKNDRRSRPQRVADAIKDMIVAQEMRPGERLPGEPELIERFGMSKSTVREAVRLLDAQGLIQTRTGPGGGNFVHAPSEARAQALLSNYFYFQSLSVRDIYQLRLALEPTLAYELAGTLTEAQHQTLYDIHRLCATEARTNDDERQQHIASLEFHRQLASYSSNPILRFNVVFLASMLMDVTTHRRLFDPPNPDLRTRGFEYQTQLLEALQLGDKELARQVLKSHMAMAQHLMEQQEAAVTRRFLTDRSLAGKNP